MKRKALLMIPTAVVVGICFSAAVFAAETKAQAAPAKPKVNFTMIAGTLTAIDNSDPANAKITVKSDADGSVRTISVAPNTNVMKATDMSELKTGDPVRIMARKANDKDVAMQIMFGKMRPLPAARPVKK